MNKAFLVLILVFVGVFVTVNLSQRPQKFFTKASAQDQILSVKDFGARGDNITDDTQAIQQTINQAAQSKKAVYFPPGWYKISSLNLTNLKGLQLIGASQYSSQLIGFGNAKVIIDLTGAQDIKLEQITFQLLHNAQVDMGVMLASSTTQACQNITFDNFQVISNYQGTDDGNWTKAGVYIYGCSNIIFSHASISGKFGFQTLVTASVHNDYQIPSSYTQITSGYYPTQNIFFLADEIHNFSDTAIAAVMLNGVSKVKFMGGPFSSSNSPNIYLRNGASQISVYGSTMYTEGSKRPKNNIWITHDNQEINGLVVDQATCTNDKAIIGGDSGTQIRNMYLNCTNNSASNALFDFSGGSYTIRDSFIVTRNMTMPPNGSIDGSVKFLQQ